tara:strand:- start:60 stop:266 length:207 start_codon:yes stop_codon:yes gene_type:complete
MSDKLLSLGFIVFGIWLISNAFVDGTYYVTLKTTGQSINNDTWTRLTYLVIGSIPTYIGLKSLFSDKV